jgi:hypothetical protein
MAVTTSSAKSEKPEDADKPEKSGVTPVNAAGATDPAVQQLLAEQQTAVSNGDDDAIAEINKKLNELGYK